MGGVMYRTTILRACFIRLKRSRPRAPALGSLDKDADEEREREKGEPAFSVSIIAL